jgi:hypothetical protein
VGVKEGSNVIPILLCHQDYIDIHDVVKIAGHLSATWQTEWSFTEDLKYGLDLT